MRVCQESQRFDKRHLKGALEEDLAPGNDLVSRREKSPFPAPSSAVMTAAFSF
jgi:hypothetical protein